jgi:DNA-binding beta-propeller fold protein YncE
MRAGSALALLATVLAASGAAARAPECVVAWATAGGVADRGGMRARCDDGGSCDLDAAPDGGCTFAVRLCAGGAACGPPADDVAVSGEVPGVSDALAAVPPAGGCTGAAVRVALGRARRKTRTLEATARAGGRDRDRLRLTCARPRSAAAGRARAIVATTDFETGLLVTVGVGNRKVTHLETPIHADAVVRAFGDRVYVVNRYLADNLQVLDPRRGFTTVLQCSTGPGSNPHDVAFVSPRKAYVTRYSERGLWIVDPGAASCAAFHRGTIDLRAFADADGIPEMDQMAIVGDRLLVAVQRLDRERLFEPAGRSQIVVVDTTTDAVVGAVELSGRNAFNDTAGLQREPGTGKLLVGLAGDVFQTGDGGVERFDPVALRAEGFVVTETALGGNLTDFVVASPTRGYAVVFLPGNPGRNSLVAFDPSRGTRGARLFAADYYLPDVALAPDGTLWLADQSLPSPGIRFFDAATGRQLGRGALDVGLPPFTMAFLR